MLTLWIITLYYSGHSNRNHSIFNYDENIDKGLLDLSITPNNTCWGKLVVSDSKRGNFFQLNIDHDRWQLNKSVPLYILKDKYESELKVVMKFVNY